MKGRKGPTMLVRKGGELSHVGMVLCCICHEPFEILLNRQLKPTLYRETIIPGEVCDKCRNTYLKEGVMLINPDTGSLAVVKDEDLERILNDRKMIESGLKKRVMFAPEGLIQALINAAQEAQNGKDIESKESDTETTP